MAHRQAKNNAVQRCWKNFFFLLSNSFVYSIVLLLFLAWMNLSTICKPAYKMKWNGITYSTHTEWNWNGKLFTSYWIIFFVFTKLKWFNFLFSYFGLVSLHNCFRLNVWCSLCIIPLQFELYAKFSAKGKCYISCSPHFHVLCARRNCFLNLSSPKNTDITTELFALIDCISFHENNDVFIEIHKLIINLLFKLKFSLELAYLYIINGLSSRILCW